MSREIIRQSWDRSRRYGIPVGEHLEIPSISQEELDKRLISAAHIINILDHFIVPLQKVLKDRDYTLGYVDSDGVILKVYKCNLMFENYYQAGKIWREKYVGTTGVGLALATEKVAVVDLDEHYNAQFKSVLAIGHPIFVYGHLLGVINLAIDVKDGIEYVLNLVSVLANRVEEQLLLEESFQLNTREVKSLEQVFRTFMHEIKNPLTNIRAFLQLQQLRAEESKKHDFDTIVQEVDRISEMIENFKYFSIGRDFRTSEIDLAALLKNVQDILKGMFDLKGWELSFHPANDCKILGNESKLKQVFLNIIKNAFEAIEEDGQVVIDLKKEGSHCIVQITDNGEGILPEDMELLFQPFYTTKSSGYGLGLPLCREIVARHHGSIVFDSVKGEGTTVSITFPLMEAAVQILPLEEVAVNAVED